MSRVPVQKALFKLARRSGDGAAVIGVALTSAGRLLASLDCITTLDDNHLPFKDPFEMAAIECFEKAAETAQLFPRDGRVVANFLLGITCTVVEESSRGLCQTSLDAGEG